MDVGAVPDLATTLAQGVGQRRFRTMSAPKPTQMRKTAVRTSIATGRRSLAIIAILLALAGCGVNTIPTKEERAHAAWAEVQNQYQRRADLVPNLVATVRGYAEQERTVLEEVTQARASATQVHVDAATLTDPEALKRYQDAQAQLSGVLGRLLAITENYPELRSNQNFLALQSQLEGTENRIAIARRDYNEAVRDYNTEIRTFPGAIWAGTVYRNARPMTQFAAESAAQHVPTVSFGPNAPPPASQAAPH
jgi:LemA protein